MQVKPKLSPYKQQVSELSEQVCGHLGWNRHNSMTLATVCVRSLEVTVEKSEGHRVPAMAVSAQEKLDRWLEAA